MDFSFPINPTLTAIAIAFQNQSDSLIADTVLPRIPSGYSFKWTKYSSDQAYTLQDTRVGNKSAPNRVDFGGSEQLGKVNPYGLMDSVGGEEIEAFEKMPKPASGGPLDPRQLSAMMLTNLILLDREVRVANLVFNPATYPASQQAILAGSSQWSDPTSDPITTILSSLDTCLVRPNALVFGRSTFTSLRKHPKIVQAVFRNLAGAGVVTREAIAEIFEVKQVLVGDAFLNTARKNQPVTNQRAWGKHAAALYINQQAAETMQPVFGFTAQMGARIAGDIPNPELGLAGGVDIKVGEYVQEVIAAPETAFFWQNATA